MIYKPQIKEILKAKTPLHSIELYNEFATLTTEKGISPSTLHGTIFPLVHILGYTIQHSNLISLEIKYDKFLPLLFLKFKTNDITFLSNHSIFDGEIVSIFLRSPSDKLKPIRNDYEIFFYDYEVSTYESLGSENIITIIGRLKIPTLYFDRNIAINDTSYNLLLKLANDLTLGFASNINSTDDKMNWICNTNYEDFINNITEHSWIDNNSFLKSFIDLYYNLNFIDINKQLKLNLESNPGILSSNFLNDTYNNKKIEIQKDYLFLTNAYELAQTNHFFTNFKIKNNSSYISNKNGFGQLYSIYDFTTKTEINDISEPLINEEVLDKIYLRGRIDTYEQNFIKRKWLGLQYSSPIGNVHKNYNYSKYHNKYNNDELDKMYIELHLPQINFNIYKYQKIPVFTFSYLNRRDAKILENINNKAASYTSNNVEAVKSLNKLLSGDFIVIGYSILYNSIDNFSGKQILKLSRREWDNQLLDS